MPLYGHYKSQDKENVNMKKNMTRILAILCMAALLVSLAACNKKGATNDRDAILNEAIDESRTQLYVFNFAGGYGVDWLIAAKQRFEELHKDDVIEEGKKGVQIVINNEKTQGMSLGADILDKRDEIYFAEHCYYYALKNLGVLADITEAVTGDLAAFGDAAGTTIESKLTEGQKDYYSMDGKYYGIPHYAGYSGIIYNVDLFEEKGYYFKDNYGTPAEIEDYFIYSDADVRSTGPDGKLGTYDDGLPATYEEFFILCRYIQQSGDTPIMWNGAGHTSYVGNTLDALAADHEGYEQKMLNYTLTGTATTLGTIQDGKFVKDSQPTDIASDPYAIFRQEGKYNALSFFNTIIKEKYYYEDVSTGSFNSSFSHTEAQNTFLMAGHDGVTPNIAMMSEGIWWESEATDTFAGMANSMGSEFAKTARNFGLMPMPKADKDHLGKSTLLDNIYSLCFMKANIAEYKKAIAIEFIKFVNSDASLKEFTTITNTPKALNYTMTNEEMAAMTSFGRSVMNLKQNSDIVYAFSSNPKFVNNQGQFESSSMYYSRINGTDYQSVSGTFYDVGVTAEQYFAGMYAYYKSEWASIFK